MNKLYLLLILLLAGCSGGGTGSSPPSDDFAISLAFTRIAKVGLDDIKVSATITNNAAPASGIAPVVTLGSGTLSTIVEASSGVYDFTVTPGSTGEFPIAVSYGGVSKSGTALVLNEVHMDWGQPMSVEGLVNTEGYEDGPVISADGEWLFVQTGPIYFSGLTYFPSAVGCSGTLVGCAAMTHGDWVYNTIGSYAAPERPGFYTKRIVLGQINHFTDFYGGLDIFSPPTLFYGFKRQVDGSYKQPFRISIDDNQEALLSPFGLYPRLNSASSATILFAFNDPTDQQDDGGHEIYSAPITLGQDNDLMTFTTAAGMTRVSTTATLLNFPSHVGTQGNPHLYSNGDGTVNSVWVDNEYNSDPTLDLFYYELTAGTFPSGTWSSITQLPTDKLDLPGSSESMPFFDGATLYLHRDSGIVSSNYLGGAYSTSGSWTSTISVIDGGGSCTIVGCISVVGEPTIATIDGKIYLFFVYALLRSYDGGAYGDVNMQIGAIEKK
ncbi:MAG: hypothetical protein JKX75_00410 [Gammaproteobacteria bacterium]|nr:hypothetical protein [Gammaproteobacteria bacterium]